MKYRSVVHEPTRGLDDGKWEEIVKVNNTWEKIKSAIYTWWFFFRATRHIKRFNKSKRYRNKVIKKYKEKYPKEYDELFRKPS